MYRLLVCCAAASCAVACSHDLSVDRTEALWRNERAPGQLRAQATLDGKSGAEVSGLVRFTAEKGDTTIVVALLHAPPGEHAVHLHTVPDCSASDASSAGDHWNPTKSAHGQLHHAPYHLGDIGNVVVDDTGAGTLSLTTTVWSVGTGEAHDVVGHSVVVHANADDFTSQPAGNSGPRIACGVVVLETPPGQPAISQRAVR